MHRIPESLPSWLSSPRSLETVLGVAVLLGTSACGGDKTTTPANDVASVQIIAAPTNPRVGETTLVSATPVNAGGVRVMGVACTYASSAPNVATAAQSGADALVTGVSVGTATITATCADRNNSIVITVRPPLVTLTLTKLGTGPGGLFADPPGLTYDMGTVVTVTASPVANSVFMGWGGACAGLGACVVPMTANKAVTGTFDPRYTVTVTTAGTGTGTVTANPPGPAYAPNTIVTLTAVPYANSTFVGWAGACSGTGPCVVTMDANKAATAIFALPEAFTGATFSAALGSMSSSSSGCVFANSAAGSMNLKLVENADGTVSGSASASVTLTVVVTFTPASTTCTGGVSSHDETGAITGTDASLVAKTASASGRTHLTFNGARTGNTITGALTINAIFTITDNSGFVTDFPFSKVINSYTITKP